MTTTTTNQSENPVYVAAHRSAFSTLSEPTTLEVGENVWIVDHYYPGVVRHVGPGGHAVVETWWDSDDEGGSPGRSELHYHRSQYRQLRVDAASKAFWPVPRGWTSIEA